MTYTRPLKRDTLIIAAPDAKRRTSARCPTCGIDRPTFHDQSGAAFFTRHQQAGKAGWCEMGGKKVTK